MKHKFSSGKTQGADPTLVGPNEWNDIHVHGITSLSTNTTLTASHDLILATAGAGGITLTLPTAVGISGRGYKIKRVDSGAGNVTIATTSSQTIDGLSTFLLVNQYQWVEVISDGSNWIVWAAN